MTVTVDVRNYLLNVSAASAGGCFLGPMRKAAGGFPVDAITIAAYGGPQPHGYQDGSNQTYRSEDVQLRVRGPVNGFVTTLARAESLWTAMNRPSSASISTGSALYVRVQPLQSGPIWMGEDDQERPEFSINVRLESQDVTQLFFPFYYGATATDIDTEAEVVSLSSDSATSFVDFEATASTSQYLWYAAPTSLGTPTFTVNGFEGGFQFNASVSVASVAYSIYRSVHTNLGDTFVDVEESP